MAAARPSASLPRRRLVRVGEIVVRLRVGVLGQMRAPTYRCNVFAWRRIDPAPAVRGIWSPAERARMAEMMGRVG